MPTHFHYLLNTTKESVVERKSGGLVLQQLTYGIKQLLSSYTKSFNVKNGRTGNLFQQKTKAKDLAEGSLNYSETAFYYIHQNPWTAALVTKIDDWPFSSYGEFIGKRSYGLVNKPLAKSLLNVDFEKLETEVYQRISPEKEILIK
jgi:hypothetical protein